MIHEFYFELSDLPDSDGDIIPKEVMKKALEYYFDKGSTIKHYGKENFKSIKRNKKESIAIKYGGHKPSTREQGK